jgi:hypothetical protein
MIVETIEKDDGTERVVIYQYLRRQNYCIGLEKKAGDGWEKKGLWPTDSPDSLEGTIRWAKRYFPWVPAK